MRLVEIENSALLGPFFSFRCEGDACVSWRNEEVCRNSSPLAAAQADRMSAEATDGRGLGLLGNW